MKKFIFSICAVIITMNTMAQDWAPVGATWHYTEIFAFSGDYDYIRIESVKDTLYMGRLCRKLEKRHNILCADRPYTEYMYSENGKVYFYDDHFDEFQVLYDFDAAAGDEWIIKVLSSDQAEVDTFFVHVDSVTTVNINQTDLNRLYVTYNFHNETLPGFSYPSVITEKLGDEKYMFNFFPEMTLACDMNDSQGLRCYQDPEFGLHETGIADSCDLVTGIHSPDVTVVTVHPNPASDLINVNGLQHSPVLYRVFDIHGKVVITGETSGRINIRSLSAGIYFLELSNPAVNSLSRIKIIRN